MTFPKFYIGPLSKNIVDVVIEENIDKEIGFILSRRQIDFSSGYVNGWSTKSFYNYIKSQNKKIILCRDHGGQNQGELNDDGITSFKEDAKYLDLIHIDPFLSSVNLDEAIKETIFLIQKIYLQNNKIFFEVGTEESIFRYEPDHLKYFLSELKSNLPTKVFNNIKYAVIQSGTSLNLPKMKNTGKFDIKRTLDFLKVTKNFGLLSKEHNGDYQIDNNQLNYKISLGIDAINIAPEFGQLESIEYLNLCCEKEEFFNDLYRICYESNKWRKWVLDERNITQKEIILTCCHYLLSNENFKKTIKNNFPNIDLIIKKRIKKQLKKMYD